MADFKDFVPVLTGLMGGGFGLLGVYMANRMNAGKSDQAALDDWGEKYTIEECLEPILTFVFNAQHRMQRFTGISLVPDAIPLPGAALFRFDSLTKANLTDILKTSEMSVEYGINLNQVSTLNNNLNEVIIQLQNLQAFLFDYKVSKKSDIMSISKNERVKAVTKALGEIQRNLEPLRTFLMEKYATPEYIESVRKTPD